MVAGWSRVAGRWKEERAGEWRVCWDGRWIFLGRRGRVLVLWFFLSGEKVAVRRRRER